MNLVSFSSSVYFRELTFMTAQSTQYQKMEIRYEFFDVDPADIQRICIGKYRYLGQV